jgi:hypothetical protein
VPSPQAHGRVTVIALIRKPTFAPVRGDVLGIDIGERHAALIEVDKKPPHRVHLRPDALGGIALFLETAAEVGNRIAGRSSK